MNKPKRLIVSHVRTQNGSDLFSVSTDKRSARRAATHATDQGHRVISTSARFDFTLASWGLAEDAVLLPSPMAARALATVKAPKAPRTPKAAAAPKVKRGGPAFAATAPTSAALKLVALSALEDFYFARLSEVGVTPEARAAFAKYEKLKALALGSTSSTAAQTEADSALRTATVTLTKLSY